MHIAMYFMSMTVNNSDFSEKIQSNQQNVFIAWVAEQVDARDLKSLDPCDCTSSILVPGTNKNSML